MAGEGRGEAGSPEPLQPPGCPACRRQPRAVPGRAHRLGAKPCPLLVPLLPCTGYSRTARPPDRGVWVFTERSDGCEGMDRVPRSMSPRSLVRGGGCRVSAGTPRTGLTFLVVPAAKKAGPAVSELRPPEGNSQRRDAGKGRHLCPGYSLIRALHRGEVFYNSEASFFLTFLFFFPLQERKKK